MATASVTNTFVAATAAVASEVNTNFTNLVDFANNSTIHKDGSKAFTGNVDAGSNKIVNLTSGTAATDAASVANVTNSIPAGTITMYGGSSAPSLWLLCDGSPVSRVTYAALFAAIGTTFGPGDGVTTFDLPDFQDKYPIGDSGSLTLGATVGSNDAITVSHTHTGPSHTHTVSGTAASSGAHTHAHGDGYNAGSQSPLGAGQSWMFVGGGTVPNTGSGGAHTHTVSGTAAAAGTGDTGSTGASGTNANRPQSVVVNYIIRAGV